MTRHTLFQRGYVSDPIETRRGTAYLIRYRVPGPGGKWTHKAETLYGLHGKKAARAILNERLQEAASINPLAAELTLRAFVEGFWKPYLDRKQVKPSTRQGYQSVLHHHILPSLGERMLTDVVPIDVERLLQTKAKAGYSPTTMRNIVVLLNGIFHLAADNDLIPRSPVRDRHRPVCHKTEKPAWTPVQVRRILETVPAEYRCAFTCVALTGLRLGELLALQWQDIELQTRTLRVVRSLWKNQLVTPKTKASVRSIPIGDVLAETLASHRALSAFTRPEDFVFCKPDGAPFHPDVLRKDVLYPALDRLNIPRPKGAAGFHAFRHSAATLVHAETGNLKLTQRFLGHTSVTTTADIYTHTSESMEREAAAALERSIFGNLFSIVLKTGTENKNTIN